jgi:hypothetical protein
MWFCKSISIAKFIYDFQASQFWASEQYVKGIALANERRI